MFVASNNLVKFCETNNKLKRLTIIICMETNKLNEKFLALMLAMWNTRHMLMCFSDPCMEAPSRLHQV